MCNAEVSAILQQGTEAYFWPNLSSPTLSVDVHRQDLFLPLLAEMAAPPMELVLL